METNNNKIKGTADDDFSRALGVQNFRTLQDDMVNAVKKQGTSVSRMIISDKKRKRENGYLDQKIPIERKRSNMNRNLLLGFGIIVVIVAAVLVGIGSMWKDVGGLFGTEITNSIIPVNKQVVLNVDKKTELPFDDLTESALVENNILSSELLHLRFIKETEVVDKETGNVKKMKSTLPVDEFFKLWKNNTPEVLVRSFKKEDYMFGFYNDETKTSPFLLFELKSFDQAFAGMLKWEKTMCEDLQIVFQDKEGCAQSKFKNNQLLDIDIRIIEAKQGVPAMLYGFLNNESVLIITKNKSTFEKILSLFN